MGPEAFRYDGKRALVVGGASGMGAATASLVHALGGHVTVVDVQDAPAAPGPAIRMDLRDPAGIDRALAEVDGSIDALFSCAGVSGAPFSGTDVVTVNFIGQRYLIEQALAADRLPAGAAIVAIASIGGLGWDRNLATLNEFLDITDFTKAQEWIDAHPEHAHYGFSKQAFITYAKRVAIDLIRRGVRINVTAPGPTLTPLMDATPEWQGFIPEFERFTGSAGSTADQQAPLLAFLGSDAAQYVSGQVLCSDLGYTGAGSVRAIDAMLVDMLAPPLS
jgi:NAD(P)-dependent dehydrogenase (short-subunit alcohol dehydrogenase family)